MPLWTTIMQEQIISAQVGEAADPSDETLARQRDPQAVSQLYQRYVGLIYRYCYVRLGSKEAAEDATSEVFLKLVSNLANYRGGLFAAWLYRIAHNTVADSYRRKPAAPLEAASEVVDRLNLEEATITSLENQQLRAALQELPDEQRSVLELQLAGWDGPQIAAALGKSQAAVKMLRHRAVIRLRKQFEGVER